VARPTDSNSSFPARVTTPGQEADRRTRRRYYATSIDLCNDHRRELVAPPSFELESLPKPKEIHAVPNEYVARDRRGRFQSLPTTTKRVQMAHNGDEEVELQKSNILLLGPTGCGKTLLARHWPGSSTSVCDRRRHRADRGRYVAGCREHPPEADPGRRLRRQEGRADHPSTRSTRLPARRTIPRSRATSPARASSRRS
jgi:hypothetical protein